MKRILYIAAGISLMSCSQIEEKINQTIDNAATTVKEKAQEKVTETINTTISESINSVANGQNVEFNQVFPDVDPNIVAEYSGKKVTFPNGSSAVIMRYKSDASLLIPQLEKQITTDEAKSDTKAQKIDGQSFIDKLSFFEKFIPAGTFDTSFLEELKTDKSLEFYKLNRFPNKSTIIVNPKTSKIYQFVEIKK